MAGYYACGSKYYITLYIVAHKKYDQNESMTTYLVILLNNYSCTNSDGKKLNNMDLNLWMWIKDTELKEEEEQQQHKEQWLKNTGIDNKVILSIKDPQLITGSY